MGDNIHNQPNVALLIELVKMKMPFGKYKGTVLSNISVTYLEWFKNKGFPKSKLGVLLETLYDQMPMFRKKYTRYNMYSGKIMDEIFTAEQKQGMQQFVANCFESGILMNNGNNHFTFEALPERAQLSTINDIVVEDFDKDGIKDILVCGNNNDADVSTGNYDATAALLLKGKPNGKFTTVDYITSGLKINGEVRKMIYLKEKNKSSF